MCDKDCDCASVKYVNKCVCKLKERTDKLQIENNKLQYQINKLTATVEYLKKEIRFIDKQFTVIGNKIELNVPINIWENGHIIGEAIFNDKCPIEVNIDRLFDDNYDELLNGGTYLYLDGIIIGTFILKDSENVYGATNVTTNTNFTILSDELYGSSTTVPVYSGSKIPDYVILSICGNGGRGTQTQYWDKNFPTTTGTGSGGSGAYIRAKFYYEFTYIDPNNIYTTFTIKNIIIDINNTINVKLNYLGDDRSSTFTVYLTPGSGTDGESSFYNTDNKCMYTGTKYGSTGKGGVASYTTSNSNIRTDLYIKNIILVNGQNGGNPNKNGTANYTSSGSGVNTLYYTFTKEVIYGFCNVLYNYPSGPTGNPPQTTNMTLPGSSILITSSGGGKEQVSSGYGAGGGSAPVNWKIDGVNKTEEIISGQPGFCQVMWIKDNL